MKMTVDWQDIVSISPIERAVVFLLAFMGEKLTAESLAILLGRVFNGATSDTLEVVLERLGKRKLPVELLESEDYGHYREYYGFTGVLTRSCALELVHSADSGKWWPSEANIVQAYSDKMRYWNKSDKMRYVSDVAAVFGFMRLFVLGSDVDAPSKVVDAFNRNREPICRAAALRLVLCLGEPPVFAPSVSYLFRDGLFHYWLNLAFACGGDVRPVLRIIASEVAHGATLDTGLLEVYAALCVWTGWSEGLNAFGKKGGQLVSGLKLACSGDFANADSVLRKYYESPHNRSLNTNDNLPARLLYQTICMAGKPGKMRPAKIMRCEICLRECRFPANIDYDYLEVIRDISGIWYNGWKVAWDGQDDLLENLLPEKINVPTLMLMAWSYNRLICGRAKYKQIASEICSLIPRLCENGYVNLCGLLLSLMSGAYTDDQQQAALAAMESSGVWFIPRVQPEPEWKSLLSTLEEEVAKTLKATVRANANASARHLIWKVKFQNGVKVGANQEVVGIYPVLAEEKDGRERRKLFYIEDFQKAKEIESVSAEDRLLVKILMSHRNYYWGDIEITADAIAQLCELPNLELDKGDEGTSWSFMTPKFKPVPITFERQPCCLESTIREDGGVALALPSWVNEAKKSYVIRRIEPGRYAYVPITESVDRIAKLFNVYGEHGKIELPKEAMGSAQGVLADLEKIVPVANPNTGKTDNLPRVKGASECGVRLDFVEGVLSVRAVVRPIAGNAALVVEPGLGLAEKLVSGAAGAYWLVRDLDAERLGFQRIHSALAGAEDWFDGRSSWQIEDLPTAIESLVRLKALDPAVPLEWMDTRRLNVVNAPKSGVMLQSSRTADEWFSVNGTFALDDGRVVNVLDLLASMSSREGRYVRLSDGDYVALTKSMAKELDALASVGRKKGGALEISRAALPMLDDVFDGSDDESLALPEAMAVSAEEIRAALRAKPKVPTALQATLRPYQTEGYTWLSRLAACGFGSCLADDMGLGKTLQVIALLLERIADGVSLVIAPSSVCGNWRNEIRRFAPTLNPVLALECADEQLAALKPGDVLISSYGYLLFHESAFAAIDWNGLVLDEAQAIKNEASKRAHLVKRLHARFRVAATGTPVENHLGELWSLFDFLNPGLLGPITAFAARFVKDGKAVPALKKVVKPLILRRLKGDVLDDLPEKTEVTIPVELGKEERSAYEGCRLHALAALASKDSQEDRFSILAELTRLRRFCCHPSLVLGADAGIPSAKMEALVDLLESLHQGQHKALVFSQFTDYLKLVQQVVSAHGWSFKYLDGSTPTKERERLVNEFQTGESEFFLISLKAGGTGLNLTAANYVILLDPWWNPAVENQAADRAHRIGQKQPVTVYRLVASDTVEERVIELHKEKTALAADLLEGTAKSSFTPADLIKLFQK